MEAWPVYSRGVLLPHTGILTGDTRGLALAEETEALEVEQESADEPKATQQEEPVEESDAPTEKPTEKPAEAPTEKPAEAPTGDAPTGEPAEAPTEKPTETPTEKPAEAPTEKPAEAPTEKPAETPTGEPTEAPTGLPTGEPTAAPSETPTVSPAPLAVEPGQAVFDINPLGADHTDLVFTFLPEDADFQSVEGLTPDVDFVRNGNRITVFKDALVRYAPGESVLSFLFAGDARAAVPLRVVDTGLPLTPMGTSVLTIGDTDYDAVALAANPTGEGWSWDNNSKTLTLDGFDGGSITYAGNLTIQLSGSDDKLTGGLRPGNIVRPGLEVSGSLTFLGSGCLTVTGTGGAVQADSLSIQSGKLKLTGTAYGGIAANGKVEIGGTAEVTAGGNTRGITAGTLKITGGKTVSGGGASATTFTMSDGDFEAAGSLSIKDLTLTGGSLSAAGETSGLYITHTLTMSGGTINATASSKSPSGGAIRLSSSGSGYKMEATGGTLNLGGDYLIYFDSYYFPVSLKDVTIRAISAPKNVLRTTVNGTGQWTLNNVVFEGSAATAQTVYNYNGTVTIKDTEMPASDSGTAFFGGNLTVESGSRITQRIETGTLTVNGGDIDIRTAQQSAIAASNLRITGGSVKARGAEYGISCEDTVISGTPDMEVIGNTRAFYASSVMINGSPYTQHAMYVTITDGMLAKAFSPFLSLTIGGADYDIEQLLEDQSGVGWHYSAQANTIALNGYSGGPIAVEGEPTFALTGDNTAPSLSATRPMTIGGGGGLTLSGDEGLSAHGLTLAQASLSAQAIASAGTNAVTVGSGSLTAGYVSSEGPIAVSGGTLYTGYIETDDTFTWSGGTGETGAITAKGNVSLSGGSLTCSGIDSTDGNLSMTGGSVASDGALTGLYAKGNITISGGTLKASASDLYSGIGVFASLALTISGTPNIEAQGYECALSGSPMKLAGKAFKNASQRVVIVNGKLQSSASLPIALVVGGKRFTFDEVEADQSGDGWSWRTSDRRLTLNGYDAGAIIAYVDLTVYLASGSNNTITADDNGAIYGAKSIRIAGSGSVTLKGDGGGISAKGDVTLAGGHITSDAAETENAYGIISSGNVLILGGSFKTTLQGSANNFGITAMGSFTMSGGSVTIISNTDSVRSASGVGVSTARSASITGGRLRIDMLEEGSVGVFCSGLKVGYANISARAYFPLVSTGSFSINGGVLNVTAYDDVGIYAINGSSSIQNASIDIYSTGMDIFVQKGSLSVTNSSIVSTSATYYEDSFTLATYSELKITDSLVIGTDFGARKVTLPGSLLFQLPGSGKTCTLLKSATLTRSFSLPSRYDYYVPEGVRLVIGKGKQIRLYASGWTVDGRVSGSVIGQSVAATAFTVSGPTTVAAGQRITLTAQASNGDATDPSVYWESSDESVATVSSSGVVTAKSPESTETVTITATAKDGRGGTGSHQVTVVPCASRIDITPTGTQTIDLYTSATLQLSAAVSPADAQDDVAWTSSNAKVASVDPATGLVTGRKAGSITITATAKDGSKVAARVQVNVTKLVADVTITGDARVIAGRSTTLKPVFTPADATNRSISWKSDNPSVRVSSKGVVTVKKGTTVGSTAKITATCKDAGGANAQYTITVSPPATSVVISGFGATDTMKVGDTLQLSAQVVPDGALERVTWAASPGKLAIVSATGFVTAKKAGIVTITATAADGTRKKATLKITITK